MKEMNFLNVVEREGKPVMEPGRMACPEIKEDEILVKIKAAAINRADLFQKSGKYPPPEGESDVIGLEMAGEVMECGSKSSFYKKGARVFGLLPGGGYAERSEEHTSELQSRGHLVCRLLIQQKNK